MSGQFEQDDFSEVLLAGTGKSSISITCEAVLDEQHVRPNGVIKPTWCVSFLLVGPDFSIAKILAIGGGKSCEQKAKSICELINKYTEGYKTLKEALSICLPDNIDSDHLEEWQVDTLNNARKIIEEK